MKGVGRQMLVFSGLDLYARWVGVNSIPVLDDFRCGGDYFGVGGPTGTAISGGVYNVLHYRCFFAFLGSNCGIKNEFINAPVWH